MTATDADTGDTVTFSLEGTRRGVVLASLPTSGQIQYESGAGHADRTKDDIQRSQCVASGHARAAGPRIAVTITVSDNSPPVFLESFASRSVAESQPARTAVGDPVSATDPDQRDTLDLHAGWRGRGLVHNRRVERADKHGGRAGLRDEAPTCGRGHGHRFRRRKRHHPGDH